MNNRIGNQSIKFANHPSIAAAAAIAGKKESQGPLCRFFDKTFEDTKFGQKTWEKAESKMQEIALETAAEKRGITYDDIDVLFAGDLLNQCIGSSFSLRNTNIPYCGLYGACSTMAESLLLASIAVDGGYANTAAAMTSSHFATAERQYRFPLVYGGQRTPTAQWTVTGSGCIILQKQNVGPYINACTIGKIVDYGITDANNMGAAMAPAAYATISQHFEDLKIRPSDYDLILTGDLGKIGKSILADLFTKDGYSFANYDDCGCLIYDLDKQDVHAGGSGCGCGAVTLCGYVMDQMLQGKIKNVLFCATGALLSPVSTQQGESIPGICHAISIGVAPWNL